MRGQNVSAVGVVHTCNSSVSSSLPSTGLSFCYLCFCHLAYKACLPLDNLSGVFNLQATAVLLVASQIES